MISRRFFLGLGAGALGALAVGAAGSQISHSVGAFAHSNADLLGNDPALHLIRRTTFGPNPQLLADVRGAGTAAWLDRQLSVGSNPDPMKVQLETAMPKLGWSAQRLFNERNAGSRDVLNDIIKATAARAAWSPHQLHEVMTSFWSNHFNVYVKNGNSFQFRNDFDSVIRSGALDSFSDLLRSVIMHPAMLVYLNGNTSTKTNPNENLGRELLELHTLGVGHYSETDVKNSALMLTGLGVKANAFFYNPATHFTGPLSITSFSHDNTTAATGLTAINAYLDFLAHSPVTAKHIATKLATKFVSDAPPESLINKLANTYLAQDTQIAPVLRALFTSLEFTQSVGQKYRAPYDDAMATIRVLGHKTPMNATQWTALNKVITATSQVPLSWPTPDGYPLVITPWLSPASTLARMNVHFDLAASKVMQASHPGITTLLPSSTPAEWSGAIDALSIRLLFTTIRPEHRDAILTMIGKKAEDPVSTAEYEKLSSTVIGPALLNSPYFWTC